MRTIKALIRMGGCQGWYESSLGAHLILLFLSWDGSYWCFVQLKHVSTWWTYLIALMSRNMTNPTKRHVHPAKTQINLAIRQSSLSACRKIRSLPTHAAHSEDSDQTGRMTRLWVFAELTGHFVFLFFFCGAVEMSTLWNEITNENRIG